MNVPSSTLLSRRDRRLRNAIERLEPRTLLSGTLAYTVPDALVHNLVLSVVQVGSVPTLQLVDDNLVVAMQPVAGTTNVSVTGAAGADTLSLDFSGGSVVPAGGLSFTGGGATNRLVLQNGSFSSEMYTAADATSGSISLDGAMINFSNLGSIVDTAPTASLSFTATAAQQQLNVVNGADFNGVHTTEFNGGATPAFATLDFANKNQVTLSAGTNDNTIVLNNSVAAANMADFMLDTQTGADTVSVFSTPAGVNTQIASLSSFADGPDTVTVGNLGSVQAILGMLDISTDADYSNVVIDDSADTIGRTIVYGQASVTGVAPAAITWTPSDIGTITLNGGSGGNHITVTDTVFGSTNTINTGAGSDTVTIQSISGGSVLNIEGQSGQDQVNVTFGVFGSSAGGLAGYSTILGTLDVTNSSGGTSLTLDTTAQTGNQTVTIAAGVATLVTTVPQGAVTETVNYNLGVGGALTIRTGAGADTFNVTPSASTTIGIDAGDPTTAPGDVLNVNLSGVQGATLSSLTGQTFDHAYSFSNAEPIDFVHVETWTPVASSSADLALAMTGPATVDENGNLTYHFTITNGSTGDAADVTLTDVMPAGLTFVSASMGTVTIDNGTIVLHLGKLAAGAAMSGNLKFTVGDEGSAIVTTLTAGSSTSDPQPANNVQSVTTAILDPAVKATGGFTFSLSENVPSGNLTLATFTDPAGAESLADYSATIHWGDGTSSAGAVAMGTGGVFAVTGSHTYAKDGAIAIEVTIHHDAAHDVTVRNTAQVFDPAVVMTAAPALAAVEGASATLTLATFTDPAGPEAPGNYHALVSWGDGTTSTVAVRQGTAAGTFIVVGSHRYADEGTYHPSITVSHGTAASVTVTDTVNVADVPIVARGGLSLGMSRAVSMPVTLAMFIDPGGAEDPTVAGHYAATINWGDGSTSAGTITLNTQNSTFSVAGGHAYKNSGTFKISIAIVHELLPAVTVTDTVKVVGTPPTVGPAGLTLTSAKKTNGKHLFSTVPVGHRA